MKKNILIVCANYYPDTTKFLRKNAEYLLNKSKIKNKCIYVPGIFEIPVVIAKNIKKFDAFVALGCVIKGKTPHFDFISTATTNALMSLSVKSKKPIGNAVITCLNMNQARARKKKGKEAAKAVLSILSQK